jgi:hypothetical protein
MPSHPPAAVVCKDSHAIFLNTSWRDLFSDTKLSKAELDAPKYVLRNIAAIISREPLAWPSMTVFNQPMQACLVSNYHGGWVSSSISTKSLVCFIILRHGMQEESIKVPYFGNRASAQGQIFVLSVLSGT